MRQLRSTLLFGLMMLLFGTMRLLNLLGSPRVASLHGSDILGLTASGGCFAVGLLALCGRLRGPGN